MQFIRVIKKVIVKNPKLVKNYKLIGLFGSVLRKNNPSDIDLVTIGNNKNHKYFLNKIRLFFKAKGDDVIFFKTITNKPLKKNDKNILIHNLHYSSFDELSKKEWGNVIDVMIKEILVLYGSKSLIKKKKFDKNHLFKIIYNWCKKIKNKKDFQDFKKHYLKYLPLDADTYSYLGISYVYQEILKYLQINDWKLAKAKICLLLKASSNN